MRRALAAAAGLALLAAAGALLLPALLPEPELSVRDRPGLPGYRTLAVSGAASAGDAVSVLLAAPVSADAEAEPTLSEQALCRALWRMPGLPAEGPADAAVRVAVFSDANCPYCRTLDGLLEEAAQDRPGLRIVHHEWPVLGPPSVTAARAALAAHAQDAFRPMQRRLLRASFIATPAYVEAAARDMNLDAERLLRDMASPEVERTLEATRAAARTLGLRGTPALVVGGTVAEGALDRATLEALIDSEPARPSPCP
jgi:predicted DsbA family dithiol-disulfide isomerase